MLQEALAQTESPTQSPALQPTSPVVTEDYYVKKLEELVSEMELEQRNSKQENARLVEEVQVLQEQLLSANTSLQKERRLQTELEQEIILLRERLNSPNGRMQGSIHECGYAKDTRLETLEEAPNHESVQVSGTRSPEAEEVSSETIQNIAALHSSVLDQQLNIVQREKDRISDIWMDQMTANEAATCSIEAEKLWLANELQNYIGALAIQDEVVSAICMGIKEFEADIENRRRSITC